MIWPLRQPTISWKQNRMKYSEHVLMEALIGVPGHPDTSDPSFREPFNKRLGRCYEIAGRYASEHPNSILIHGSIEGMGFPRIGHAWVSVGPDIFEPATGHIMTKAEFGKWASPQIDDAYPYPDVLEKIVSSKNWGPW